MRFVVIGAGGHSREVFDLLVNLGHEVVAFLDHAVTGPHPSSDAPVVADVAGVDAEAAVIAIGDAGARREQYRAVEGSFAVPSLVHPLASVSPLAVIGAGSQVMQFVTVSAGTSIGTATILNVGCFVAHDARVGEFVHVAPGCRVSGGCTVGDGTLLGANSVLLPGVSVGRGCVIGAGAIVTRDMPDGVVCVGAPARVVREREDDAW